MLGEEVAAQVVADLVEAHSRETVMSTHCPQALRQAHPGPAGWSGPTVDSALRALVVADPALFLGWRHTETDLSPEKYGHMLSTVTLSHFGSASGDYEVSWHLEAIARARAPVPPAIARNRRYARMCALRDTGTFFTEDEMRRRDPLLYERVMGRRRMAGQDAPFARDMPLHARLIHDLEEDDVTKRRMVLKAEERFYSVMEGRGGVAGDGDESDSVDSDESEYDSDNQRIPRKQKGGPSGNGGGKRRRVSGSGDDRVEVIEGGEEEEEGPTEELGDDEHQRRLNTLVAEMEARFMDGLDGEFVDYDAIDRDATLDDIRQQQQDAEDRYFSDED